MSSLDPLVRPNIRALRPYSSARSEFQGVASVLLDANENPFETGFNRYPDPLQRLLKDKIAEIKGVRAEQIFLGNGSDEAIDLLIRIFCEPGVDHILSLPPTYGMYRVSADIANVPIVEVPLTADFQPDVDTILQKADAHSKLLFICSPNNPTANDIKLDHIRDILRRFSGVVVVDEAYIDFSERASCTTLLDEFERLVVLQTFSKAWGLAGVRLGMAFAPPATIGLFNKVKPPYNINQLTQDAAYLALENAEEKDQWVQEILTERARLEEQLPTLACIEHVFPSQANFLLVRVGVPRELYQFLVERGIVVRDRSRMPGCTGCLRFTVGDPQENDLLLAALRDYDLQNDQS
ncbi:MAG: histidinol-phosphate transaminase [Bacteroidota bacterium]